MKPIEEILFLSFADMLRAVATEAADVCSSVSCWNR